MITSLTAPPPLPLSARMSDPRTDRLLMNAMRLSLAIGLLMLVMKVYAFLITGSAAIFSDAAESVVHNIAVVFALFSLWLSRQPADESHPYGHEKISYFSAGFEGCMIILAACVIIFESARRWIHGLVLENLDTGMLFTVAAAIINGGLGGYLVWRGRKHGSIILEANGKHVLTDSWTSFGVVVGLLLTRFTGWLPFDPICAILVALNILWSGFDLIRRSAGGLMDATDPGTDREVRRLVAEAAEKHGAIFHELKHRKSGMTTWVELHLLFPDETSLRTAHQQATLIEEYIEKGLPGAVYVSTHLEPREGHAHAHPGHAPAP
jgi:cation diffusion facilitator family transporter